MEIAKALILAEHRPRNGRGSAASAGHLFPVANRPILFHNLQALREAGVLEATILADRDAGEAIREAVADGREWGLRLCHADWEPSAGVGGALAAGRDFLGGEPVLVQQGDALLREHLHAHIAAFAREGLDALALRLSRGDKRHGQGATPGYLLSTRAVSILLDDPGAANPVTRVRAGGGRVRIQRVDGCMPCHGDQETLLESNRRALEGLATSIDPSSLDDCSVQGPVDIDPSASIQRAVLRGPVIIGPGARITDAYIGPYTSIGAGAVIEGAEIEHSIVLAEAELRFVGSRLESSVIGRGARIVRGFELPRAIRVSIGDGAEVILK